MATPVRLQVRGPGGARCVLNHLTSETTIDDLRSQISTLMDIHPDVQRLMIGFPPRPIDTVSPQTTLATAGVRSGESIIVEKSTAPRGIQKASAAESQSVIYTIPKNTGSVTITRLTLLPTFSCNASGCLSSGRCRPIIPACSIGIRSASGGHWTQ